MENSLDIFLREELRLVNKHIPVKRLSLCELLEAKIPHVITANGGIHVIDIRELQLISEITKRDCSVKLPLIIEYIPEGEGVYVITDPVDSKIISKILGLTMDRPPIYLYRPQLIELRRKLRTTTTVLINPRISISE